MVSASPSSRSNLQVIEGGREAEFRAAPAQIARERSLESTAGKTHMMPYFVSIFSSKRNKVFSKPKEHNVEK